MARVAGHLSVEDLEAGFRSARDPTAMRHFQVIWLLARGHTIADVAAVTSFVPRWIEQLLARYNAHGPEALGDLRRRNGGVPRVLRPELLARLRARLEAPPPDGGLWSSRKVAAWMAGELGLAAVLPQRGWEALKAIGWSVQKPRLGHAGGARGLQKNYGGKARCLADWGDLVCSRAGGARWPDASQGRRIGNASYARCAACARRAGARCASATRTAAPW